MDRKKFLKRGVLGIGTLAFIPTAVTSCSDDDDSNTGSSSDCELSPRETEGPFPIKSPSELVLSNIVSDRSGVAMVINIQVVDNDTNCEPIEGVFVDIWHCDADGNYSEYGNTQMQQTDYTDKHFLRGRQTTDASGNVSFVSIYPGWYRGRAPHIHVEVLDSNENSLMVTQIAFPEDTSSGVYATTGYNGEPDTSNTSDNVFSDSLANNMADSITGNTTDGFVLTKVITV
ncbi:dioxygenase family protein [Joostella sp. CR20]|uniref:dioxygenase family protein n=1 Tax=Joostella sp. CR20 TaxID=2804312 RepID=UPI00313D8F46